jgi:hypothetical protein
MPQSDVLDQISRLLFDMFVDSIDMPIPGKRMSTSYCGCSKPGCNPYCRGLITRSTSRPRKEDLCTRGSENDDNNERTESDEAHTLRPSQRPTTKVRIPKPSILNP